MMSAWTRRDALRTIGLAGVAGVAGCMSRFEDGPNERPPDSLGTSWSPSGDSWCFPYGDTGNTARSPHGIQSEPPSEWQDRVADRRPESFVSGDLVAATPARVITADRFDSEAQLRAYDAVDGTCQWQQRIEYPSGLRWGLRLGGLVDGTLYLSDGGTDVVAVDAADGTVRWRRNLHEEVAGEVPDEFLSAGDSPSGFSPRPLATPETLYVQSGYGVHGLAPDDGTEQWRLSLGAHADDDALRSPRGLAVTDQRVWASYGLGVQSVFELELLDGGPQVWPTDVPLDFPGVPVVTDAGEAALTHSIVGGSDPWESPLAVGLNGSPDVSWQFPGDAGDGSSAYSSLATDGQRVFVCESHEQPQQFVVVALQASTGNLDWLHRESLAGRDVSMGSGQFVLCQPAVAGEALVVGYGSHTRRESGQGELVALSRHKGSVQWRTTVPVAPRHLAMTSNRLHVGGQQGGVVALAAGDSG